MNDPTNQKFNQPDRRAEAVQVHDCPAPMLPRQMIRALIAFLALPGMAAFAIPAGWLWYADQMRLIYPIGLIPLTAGLAALLWCVRDFYVSGKGTLAPWEPPQTLVTNGLYRYSRNPMYGSVFLVLIGWAISFAAAGLLMYTVAAAIIFQLRIVFGEEPWLARTHGSDWERYARNVPRWF
jgi:protein-S-isoprenylcysteine O-methyltransferase Ste14